MRRVAYLAVSPRIRCSSDSLLTNQRRESLVRLVIKSECSFVSMRGWQPICVVLQERKKRSLCVRQKGGESCQRLAVFLMIMQINVRSPRHIHGTVASGRYAVKKYLSRYSLDQHFSAQINPCTLSQTSLSQRDRGPGHLS